MAPALPKLGKKKAEKIEITVQATKLSLSLAADAAPPKSVLLEVDMPGDADEPGEPRGRQTPESRALALRRARHKKVAANRSGAVNDLLI